MTKIFWHRRYSWSGRRVYNHSALCSSGLGAGMGSRRAPAHPGGEGHAIQATLVESAGRPDCRLLGYVMCGPMPTRRSLPDRPFPLSV